MTPMTCDEARLQFSALLDGELAPEERAPVEAHLAGCGECLRALHQLQQVDNLFRGMSAQAAPDGIVEAVRETVDPPPVQLGRSRFEPRRLWPLVAAAAALLITFAGLVAVSGWMEDGTPLPGVFDMAADDSGAPSYEAPRPELLTAPDALAPEHEELEGLRERRATPGMELMEAPPEPSDTAEEAVPVPMMERTRGEQDAPPRPGTGEAPAPMAAPSPPAEPEAPQLLSVAPEQLAAAPEAPGRPGPGNLAAGRPVTASVEPLRNAPGDLVNGATPLLPEDAVAFPPGAHWIQIDLARTTRIHGITLWRPMGEAPLAAAAAVAEDPAFEEGVHVLYNSISGGAHGLDPGHAPPIAASGGTPHVIPGGGVPGRHVRLYVESDSEPIRLSEIAVHGVPGP